MVNVTNLTRRYHTRRGIENINLVLNEGEIIGLLGPNGCGKTTLIKLIMGLLQLDEGEIRIGAFHPNEAYSMVSYLPEQTYLGVWMTMDEAFSIFSSFYQDFNRQKAEQMLADFCLELKQPLKTMSKGMQEKAHLTLVMSRDVPFYILDEPMSGIDPASRESILEGILRNYNPGSTLLISTHLEMCIRDRPIGARVDDCLHTIRIGREPAPPASRVKVKCTAVKACLLYTSRCV